MDAGDDWTTRSGTRETDLREWSRYDHDGRKAKTQNFYARVQIIGFKIMFSSVITFLGSKSNLISKYSTPKEKLLYRDGYYLFEDFFLKLQFLFTLRSQITKNYSNQLKFLHIIEMKKNSVNAFKTNRIFNVLSTEYFWDLSQSR